VNRAGVEQSPPIEAFDDEVGLDDPAFRSALGRRDVLVVAAALVGASVAVGIVVTGEVAMDHVAFAALLAANILTLALGGLLWLHGRPASAFGYALLGLALLVVLSSFTGSSASVVYLVGILSGWVAALAVSWLLLAFPGVHPSGAGWVVMSVAFATFVLGELPLILVSATVSPLPLPAVGRCVGSCPANPAYVADEPTLAHVFRHVQATGSMLWGTSLLVYLAVFFARSSHPRRRLLAPVYISSVPFVAVFAVHALAADVGDLSVGPGMRAAFTATRIVLPLGFIAALVFAQAYAGAALASMGRQLRGRPSVSEVEQVVRRVLHDPQARLVFWLPRRGQYADRHGKRVVLEPAPGGLSYRAFGHGGEPTLAIVHDVVLSEDPELVEAVGTASLLALENRRLHQDLLDSVHALRASQRRLVMAASAERRRIERDLHDSAQQKLVAVRIQLELARELAESNGDLTSRLEAIGEAFDDALDELRSVAHGIYPPLLADEGLASALREAARHSTVPLTLDLEDVGRLSEDREAAVYYCYLEALQNVAKHAGEDAVASVRLWRDRLTVHFSVADDGVGFSPRRRENGAGLTNMADRMGAVGGLLSVRSEPGRGTTVEGRISVEAPDRASRDGVNV
jgi:signal transduction histidine kinase